MDSEDQKEDEDKGNSFNINHWNVKLSNFFLITIYILLNSFIWLYWLESNVPNEYLNIFTRRKKSQMNVRIYLLWKKPWIFRQMNIFVNKYLNIFEYQNIRYTLAGPHPLGALCTVYTPIFTHSIVLSSQVQAVIMTELQCKLSPWGEFLT